PCCLLSPIPRPPISTLLPYTTLFRSRRSIPRECEASHPDGTSRVALPIAPFRQETRCSTPAAPHRQYRRRVRARRPFCSTAVRRSEEHTSELQSRVDLVCRLLLEKKK